jgi:hypothetical protein
VAHLLTTHFPADRVVGEEDGAALRAELSSTTPTTTTTTTPPPSQGARAPLALRIRELVNDVLAMAPADPSTGQSRPLSMEEVLAAIDRGCASGSEGQPRFWTLDPVDGTKGFLRGGLRGARGARLAWVMGRDAHGILLYPSAHAPPAPSTPPQGASMPCAWRSWMPMASCNSASWAALTSPTRRGWEGRKVSSLRAGASCFSRSGGVAPFR